MPETATKITASIIFFSSVVLIIVINVAFSLYLTVKGRKKYKEDAHCLKLDREQWEITRE